MASHGVIEGKKEAPAIDEGEEARLCGGLWTILLKVMVATPVMGVNYFNEIFSKIFRGGQEEGPKNGESRRCGCSPGQAAQPQPLS
jgi:hypothetical protein